MPHLHLVLRRHRRPPGAEVAAGAAQARVGAARSGAVVARIARHAVVLALRARRRAVHARIAGGRHRRARRAVPALGAHAPGEPLRRRRRVRLLAAVEPGVAHVGRARPPHPVAVVPAGAGRALRAPQQLRRVAVRPERARLREDASRDAVEPLGARDRLRQPLRVAVVPRNAVGAVLEGLARRPAPVEPHGAGVARRRLGAGGAVVSLRAGPGGRDQPLGDAVLARRARLAVGHLLHADVLVERPVRAGHRPGADVAARTVVPRPAVVVDGVRCLSHARRALEALRADALRPHHVEAGRVFVAVAARLARPTRDGAAGAVVALAARGGGDGGGGGAVEAGSAGGAGGRALTLLQRVVRAPVTSPPNRQIKHRITAQVQRHRPQRTGLTISISSVSIYLRVIHFLWVQTRYVYSHELFNVLLSSLLTKILHLSIFYLRYLILVFKSYFTEFKQTNGQMDR